MVLWGIMNFLSENGMSQVVKGIFILNVKEFWLNVIYNIVAMYADAKRIEVENFDQIIYFCRIV